MWSLQYSCVYHLISGGRPLLALPLMLALTFKLSKAPLISKNIPGHIDLGRMCFLAHQPCQVAQTQFFFNFSSRVDKTVQYFTVLGARLHLKVIPINGNENTMHFLDASLF